jgi:hypothetical protein
MVMNKLILAASVMTLAMPSVALAAPAPTDPHQSMPKKDGCCPEKKDGEKKDDCCKAMKCCDSMKPSDTAKADADHMMTH